MLRCPLRSSLFAIWWVGAAAVAVALAGCSDKSGNDGGVIEEAGPIDTGDGLDASLKRDALPIRRPDSSIVLAHDGGAASSCTRTCDCPQGQACLDGLCGSLGVGPVFCCSELGCPEGHSCLDIAERPGFCPAPPDGGPDAGPTDLGTGAIGTSCEVDTDCDESRGFSCWDQNNPPYLWGGYCTYELCSQTNPCPAGSSCVNFNNLGVIGCMGNCIEDHDCRGDAYCLEIPASTIRICFPDCRDDFFDCAPRDGTKYCSHTTGRCEDATTHDMGASVGDPCGDGRDCGPGQVCMSEVAFGVPGGMCTKVCNGLPEATSCGTGETCQVLGTDLGFCWKDCTAGACPSRVGANCTTYDPAWTSPSCVPQ